MSDHDDLRQRLEGAGQQAVPPPDAVFAANLEACLRSIAQTAQNGPSSRRAPRPWFRSPVALATASVLVVLLAVGTVVRTAVPDSPTLALVSAVDAIVTLPDGTQVEAAAGLDLQEGAIVRTGPTGRVVAGSSALGPNSAAVVRGGRLEPLDPPVAASPGSAPTEGALGPPERPLPTLLPSRPSDDAGSPTRPPSERPTTRPENRPTSDTKTAPPRTEETSPPARPGQAYREPDETHAIGIGVAAFRDGRHAISWTDYEHPALAGFMILRADDPNAPEWPPDRATTVVGRVPRGADPFFHDPEARRTRPVYRVVAVDGEGRELARSAALSPESA